MPLPAFSLYTFWKGGGTTTYPGTVSTFLLPLTPHLTERRRPLSSIKEASEVHSSSLPVPPPLPRRGTREGGGRILPESSKDVSAGHVRANVKNARERRLGGRWEKKGQICTYSRRTPSHISPPPPCDGDDPAATFLLPFFRVSFLLRNRTPGHVRKEATAKQVRVSPTARQKETLFARFCAHQKIGSECFFSLYVAYLGLVISCSPNLRRCLFSRKYWEDAPPPLLSTFPSSSFHQWPQRHPRGEVYGSALGERALSSSSAFSPPLRLLRHPTDNSQVSPRTHAAPKRPA